MKKLMVNEVRSMKKIAVMMVAMVGMGAGAWAQAPAAPVMSPATADAAQVAEPQAPAGACSGAGESISASELEELYGDSPTTADVNAFLKQAWGFDDNRIWSVAAILKTQAPGVASVVVFAADKAHPDKLTRSEFFITPDGKHAIAGGVVDFGPTPFAERRALLQQEADGPAEGAASKGLLMVLFAIF